MNKLKNFIKKLFNENNDFEEYDKYIDDELLKMSEKENKNTSYEIDSNGYKCRSLSGTEKALISLGIFPKNINN